ARDFTVHRSHRVQIGSGSARVPRASGPSADLDRKSELSEDLVAGHLPKGLAATVLTLIGRSHPAETAVQQRKRLQSNERQVHADRVTVHRPVQNQLIT